MLPLLLFSDIFISNTFEALFIQLSLSEFSEMTEIITKYTFSETKLFQKKINISFKTPLLIKIK
jgi:hypothetical protein